MTSALGIKGADRKHAVGTLSLRAERASSWLWMKREERRGAGSLPPTRSG